MKITIDTKEDSEHEIRKAIELLRSLSGSSSYSNQPSNIFADERLGAEASESSVGADAVEAASTSPGEPSLESGAGSAPVTGVFGNMFNAPSSSESSEQVDDRSSDDDDPPEIVPY
jgi:hypothetical protein